MIQITEPFPEWAWPLAWSWVEGQRDRVFDDSGPKTDVEFVSRYIDLYQNGRTYGIWKDGRIGGVIGFEFNSGTCATAHILVSRRLWGKENSEAFREAARQMFESLPALLRIQAFVPASNRLAVMLAKRMGGVFEGRLRDVGMMGGEPVDADLIALTRKDFYGLQRRGQQPEVAAVAVGEFLEHVLVGPVEPAGLADERVLEPGPGDVERIADAERGGTGDDGGRHDQQDIEGSRRSRAKLPRGPRVRKQRAVGKSTARDGTGAAKRTGGKCVGGSGAAAKPESGVSQPGVG